MPKLVIRINNVEPLDESVEEPQVVEETVYHWHRIIGALLVLGGLIWAGVWGYQQLGKKDVTDDPSSIQNVKTESPAEPPLKQVDMQTVDPVVDNKVVDSKVVEGSVAEDNVVEEKIAEQAVEKVVDTVVDTEAAQNVTAENKGVSEQFESKVEPEKTIEPETMAKPAKTVTPKLAEPVIVQSEPEIKISETPKTKVTASVAEVPEVTHRKEGVSPITIESSLIARSQLTTGVKDREPVDELGSVIPMNEKGLLRIFMFTETKQLKDRTLYYSWFLEDKRVAKVKIRTRTESARVSSSKFIDKYMKGSWRVEVANNAGELLATAKFEVTGG